MATMSYLTLQETKTWSNNRKSDMDNGDLDGFRTETQWISMRWLEEKVDIEDGQEGYTTCHVVTSPEQFAQDTNQECTTMIGLMKWQMRFMRYIVH